MRATLFSIITLICLTLPITLSLLGNSFYSTHDGITHVVRFARFYQDLEEGEILPRWIDNVSFGLGSPVLIFNSLLPYYLSAIPHFLGFSFAESIKVAFGFSIIFSAISFFFFIREFVPNISAIIGSLAFTWAPYRFVDVYVRGDLPEAVSFVFIPLVLLSSYKIIMSSSWNWVFMGSVFLSCLLLSHNVMFLMFGFVFILYGVALGIFLKKEMKIIRLVFSIYLSLLISAFFWIPAFFEKGRTNLDYLNRTQSFWSNFVTLKEIIYSKWGWGPIGSTSPMSLQLGAVQWISVFFIILVLILLFIRKRKIMQFPSYLIKYSKIELIDYFNINIFLSLFILSLFLMTSVSSFFWTKIELLSFFLYPWRFLSLAIFACAFFIGFICKITKQNWFFIICIIALLLYSNRNYSQLVGRVRGDDNFYIKYNDTTDMWGEFLPSSVNLSLIKRCKQTQICKFSNIVVPPQVKLGDITRQSNKLSFSYQSNNKFKGTINIFYFPGWRLYVDHKRWTFFKINTLGTFLITFPKGGHKVVLKFKNNLLMSVSIYLSILGMIILILGVLWENGLKRKYLIRLIGS